MSRFARRLWSQCLRSRFRIRLPPKRQPSAKEAPAYREFDSSWGTFGVRRFLRLFVANEHRVGLQCKPLSLGTLPRKRDRLEPISQPSHSPAIHLDSFQGAPTHGAAA